MRKILFLTVTVAVLASCINDKPQGANIGVGDVLPHFSVTMNDGSVVSDTSLRGTEALIVFFNTGCGDCRRELPVIQKYYDTCSDTASTRLRQAEPTVSSTQVVCISRAETEESVAAYWHEHGFTMPYSAQPDRRVYELFASTGIPRIYKVNKEGIITAAWDDKTMPASL